jgi:hypothetical protein
MVGQPNPKAAFGCMTTLVIIMVLVVFWTTGSLNPLAIYDSGSLLAKICFTVLAALLGFSLLQLFGIYVVNKSVAMRAGKPAEDVICPGCGLPLLKFVSSHGMPIACPNSDCPTPEWHNGHMCYNKGMPKATIVVPTYPCPRCRARANHDLDLFDSDHF